MGKISRWVINFKKRLKSNPRLKIRFIVGSTFFVLLIVFLLYEFVFHGFGDKVDLYSNNDFPVMGGEFSIAENGTLKADLTNLSSPTLVAGSTDNPIFNLKLTGSSLLKNLTISRNGAFHGAKDFYKLYLYDGVNQVSSGSVNIDSDQAVFTFSEPLLIEGEKNLVAKADMSINASSGNQNTFSLGSTNSIDSTAPLTADTSFPQASTEATTTDTNCEQRITTGITNQLYVDASSGADTNNGSSGSPFKTIAKAASIATAGTAVNIAPGIYKETNIKPANSGTTDNPIIYRQDPANMTGKVVVQGSESLSTNPWDILPASDSNYSSFRPTEIGSIYRVPFNHEAPRFLVSVNLDGTVNKKYTLAQEPDWENTFHPNSMPWKVTDYWYAADGGSSKATNCDLTNNPTGAECDTTLSPNMLTDVTDDRDDVLADGTRFSPADISDGTLQRDGSYTYKDLTGANITVTGSETSHYMNSGNITAYNSVTGTVTFQRAGGDTFTWAPMGLGSKYFIENSPELLDTNFEWWYGKNSNDSNNYIYMKSAVNPSSLHMEASISTAVDDYSNPRKNAFDLSNISNTSFLNLSFTLYQKAVFWDDSHKGGTDYSGNKSVNLNFCKLNLSHSFSGFNFTGRGAGAVGPYDLGQIYIEESDISNMEYEGIELKSYYNNYDIYTDIKDRVQQFRYPGISYVYIRNNKIHDISLHKTDGMGSGIIAQYPDHLFIEGNHIYNTWGEGIQLTKSVIESTKTSNFLPSEIKTGDILVSNNVIEKIALARSDTAGLRMGGTVFRNMLAVGNTFANIFGWDYVKMKRDYNRKWLLGSNDVSKIYSYDLRGYNARGIDMDTGSGLSVYRNVFFNIPAGGGGGNSVSTDEADNIFANNTFVDVGQFGLYLGGQWATSMDFYKENYRTTVINNLFSNVLDAPIAVTIVNGKIPTIDNNFYHKSGWARFQTYLDNPTNLNRSDCADGINNYSGCHQKTVEFYPKTTDPAKELIAKGPGYYGFTLDMINGYDSCPNETNKIVCIAFNRLQSLAVDGARWTVDQNSKVGYPVGILPAESEYIFYNNFRTIPEDFSIKLPGSPLTHAGTSNLPDLLKSQLDQFHYNYQVVGGIPNIGAF